MAHPNIRAFVTHCGDTSLGEAVEAGVPLVGIPIFADQADVCQRMHERGIGVYVGHKFEVTDVMFEEALARVVSSRNQPAFRQNIRDMQQMSNFYGGAVGGAQFLETAVREGITGHFSCGFINWQAGGSPTSWLRMTVELIRIQQYDVLVLCGFLPLLLVWKATRWTIRLLVRRSLK